jgi:putative ABC transport system permease protein
MGYGLWQRVFGADPDVVGRALVVGGTPMTVVGIMPRDFRYPPQAELWMPIVPAEPKLVTERGTGWGMVLGRLADGATPPAAQLEMDAIVTRLWATITPLEADRRAAVTPFTDHLFGPARPALFVLLGAVLLVLLIACANVCALLLARAGARQREIAVRLALGASRARLARQLLAESALIAGVGGIAGILLALGTVDLLVALVPADVPRLHDVSLDGRVMAFALVLTGISALASGLVPAVMASRPSLTEALGESARMASHAAARRPRAMLVAGEAAIALVLLSGAGLLARTFDNLRRVDLGFEPRRVLTLSISGGAERYPKQQDLYRALLERIDMLPGVEASAALSLRPLRGQLGWDWVFQLEGQSDEESRFNPFVNMQDVTPRYFETMRIPLLRGRTFSERDAEGAPGVAVVSHTMAERCWPGQEAIGQRLKIPLPGSPYDLVWLTVVGVVGDARYRELQATRPDLYMSYRQSNHGVGDIVVRTAGDPAALAPAVRPLIRSVDRNLLVTDMQTMDAIVTEALGGARFGMQLMSAFALCALILAALGTYGVMAFVMGGRTREVGVRMALGARAADVMALVIRQGMAPVAAGLVVGLAGSLALGRALTGLLFGVPPHDAPTLATATSVLGAVALMACTLPARRASRIDPAAALRDER